MKILACLLLVSSFAFADPIRVIPMPTPTAVVDPIMLLNNSVEALTNQMNAQAQELATLKAQLGTANDEIARLKAQLSVVPMLPAGVCSHGWMTGRTLGFGGPAATELFSVASSCH